VGALDKREAAALPNVQETHMTEQNLSADADQESRPALGESGPAGAPLETVSGAASAPDTVSSAATEAAETRVTEEAPPAAADLADDAAAGDGSAGEGSAGEGSAWGAAERDEDAEPDTAAFGDTENGFAEEAEATGSGRVGSRRAQLEREGEVAADFLETLLDIADLDGDIDVDIEGDRAAVAIVDSEDGRVPRRLVGQDGRVLEALQELTRLAVQSATGERSRLMLDIAGHRSERRSALVDVARTAIKHVKESGQPESLAPMSAFERKVIHDEVLAAGLVSESDGVEPLRFVVIHPA
jgi:spoIIIJ-associated protein